MHLPRGRFTDALVAFSVFAALFVAMVIGIGAAAGRYGFVPAAAWAGAYDGNAALALASPLLSLFIPSDVIGVAFDLVFLLIAGRFVERAVGPLGLGVLFVVAGYAAAAARLLLTPESLVPGAGMQPALYGVIAGYFMLYGVPAAIPTWRGLGRAGEILTLALVWIGLQVALAAMAGYFELSTTLVAPCSSTGSDHSEAVLPSESASVWSGPSGRNSSTRTPSRSRNAPG